jgi:hypothetical protein
MVVDSIIYFRPDGRLRRMVSLVRQVAVSPAAGADAAEGAGTSVARSRLRAGTATTGPRICRRSLGLAAIDARTGALVTAWRQRRRPGSAFNSPPSIFRNLIITRGPAEGRRATRSAPTTS